MTYGVPKEILKARDQAIDDRAINEKLQEIARGDLVGLSEDIPGANPFGDKANLEQKLGDYIELYNKGTSNMSQNEKIRYAHLKSGIEELKSVPEFSGQLPNFGSSSGLLSAGVDKLGKHEDLIKSISGEETAKKFKKLKEDVSNSFKKGAKASSVLRKKLHKLEFDKLMRGKKVGKHSDAALDIWNIEGQKTYKFRENNPLKYAKYIADILDKNNNYFYINESQSFTRGDGTEKPGGLNHAHLDEQKKAKSKGWIAVRHNKMDDEGNYIPGRTVVSSLGGNTKQYLMNMGESDIPLVVRSMSLSKDIQKKVERILDDDDFKRKRSTRRAQLLNALYSI